MFLKSLWCINYSIRTITRVIPTGEKMNFAKTRFIPKFGAHPSEGWGWGMAHPLSAKVNKPLMRFATVFAKNCPKGLPIKHEVPAW